MNFLIPRKNRTPNYNGQIIFSTEDEDGRIDVVDKDGFRHLHFGSKARQSSVMLSCPGKLVLCYTKAIMLPLLTLDSVENIMIMGLGGGSLPRFFLKHFPDCQVDVVEKREQIISIAEKFFSFYGTENLSLHCADAFEFFKVPSPQKYDFIIVDIYGGDTLLKGVNDDVFIASVKNSLRPSGIVAFNLIERPKVRFRQILSKISNQFQGQIVRGQLKKRLNHLIFASKDPHKIAFSNFHLPKAYELEKTLDVNLMYYLGQFIP